MSDALEVNELFLHADPRSGRAFEAAVQGASALVSAAWEERQGATRGATYDELQRELAQLEICPSNGVGLQTALQEVRTLILPAMVAVGHPEYAAHLHSVPTIPALAAEVIISATNQSLDSFDQAPSATAVERRVIAWLNAAFGAGGAGDGLFTSGATKSNLMGLMLARDRYARSRGGHDIARQGLPARAAHWRILCSELAHFSIDRAAAILGLGEEAVIRLPADDDGRLRPETVHEAIARTMRTDQQPIALVLTAGTTDLGSIDVLGDNVALAREYGLWTHVDAAAGGAFVLSARHRALLRGIEGADSIAIDLHKLLFQPISCGVFLVRRAEELEPLRRPIAYLDPNDGDVQVGPNLVAKSIETTRRFDALKVLVTLRSLGQSRLAQLLDHTVEIARQSAALISGARALELLAPPMTNTVLLRWRGTGGRLSPDLVNAVNRQAPHRLWLQGGPVVGGSVYRGQNAIKLTFTNPLCTASDVAGILRRLESAGALLCSELGAEDMVR